MTRSGSANRLARLAAAFERSGMTRREFCERHGIALTTVDYYRRRLNRTEAVRLLPVNLATDDSPGATGLAVVLANGRRIEFSQQCSEEELMRLVRAVERA